MYSAELSDSCVPQSCTHAPSAYNERTFLLAFRRWPRVRPDRDEKNSRRNLATYTRAGRNRIPSHAARTFQGALSGRSRCRSNRTAWVGG